MTSKPSSKPSKNNPKITPHFCKKNSHMLTHLPQSKIKTQHPRHFHTHSAITPSGSLGKVKGNGDRMRHFLLFIGDWW
jgi:hypothetical protein